MRRESCAGSFPALSCSDPGTRASVRNFELEESTTDDLPGSDPTGKRWQSWLPWILFAVFGVVIIGAIFFAQG